MIKHILVCDRCGYEFCTDPESALQKLDESAKYRIYEIDKLSIRLCLCAQCQADLINFMNKKRRSK